jgi:hypothetical protein
MISVVAITSVAMAIFGRAFLGGQHVYAVEAITLDLPHQLMEAGLSFIAAGIPEQPIASFDVTSAKRRRGMPRRGRGDES